MKRFFLVILIVLSASYCNAQNPEDVLEIDAQFLAEGMYVKDFNNELDKFTGTWTFSNDSTSFTIVLQKQEQAFKGDYLIGEYAYIKNGVTVINTIPLLHNTDPNLERNIGGRHIEIDQDLQCEDCSENERRISLNFSDPERDYLSTSLILRYLPNESNTEKITATIYTVSTVILPYKGAPTSTRVPYGTYLMEKQ